MENMVNSLRELAITYGLKIVLAIITLLVGLWVIKMITNYFKKWISKSKAEESLQSFLTSIFNALLKVMLVIMIASMVGIETTSLVAVLGAASLAVGLALQGSLANFAGGVLILIFKPFHVGDYIEGSGESGTVEKIDILHTTLKTPQNVTIIVPNGPLANSNITNYSLKPVRRVDFPVGISYDADVQKAREVILGVLNADERVHQDPAPIVVLTELADNSLNLSVRAWTDAGNYWAVFWEDLEKMKEALDEAGIGIPYPQRDLHIYNHGSLEG